MGSKYHSYQNVLLFNEIPHPNIEPAPLGALKLLWKILNWGSIFGGGLLFKLVINSLISFWFFQSSRFIDTFCGWLLFFLGMRLELRAKHLNIANLPMQYYKNKKQNIRVGWNASILFWIEGVKWDSWALFWTIGCSEIFWKIHAKKIEI